MEPTLFKALDDDWAVTAHSHGARAALRRWAADEPALAGLATPADVVRCCHAAQPAAAASVLGAVMRHADDALAARTVLQAVLPTLRIQVARRCGGTRRAMSGLGWEACEDFAADVVEAAVARIAALAGTSPAWPAQAVCESTWTSLRAAARRSGRRGAPPMGLDEAAENVAAGAARTDAENLALAVAGAVRAGRLRLDDARLIYATRVLGHSPAEVAAVQHRDVRALRAQRSRAERRLVRAGWAPAPATSPWHPGDSATPTTSPAATG